PPHPPLFPYPPLFRSQSLRGRANRREQFIHAFDGLAGQAEGGVDVARFLPAPKEFIDSPLRVPAEDQPQERVVNRQKSHALEQRSEEHTSELQSRGHL